MMAALSLQPYDLCLNAYAWESVIGVHGLDVFSTCFVYIWKNSSIINFTDLLFQPKLWILFLFIMDNLQYK